MKILEVEKAEVETVWNKIVKARSELVLDHPFFGVLALRLRLKNDPGCETAWADGRTLGFNSEYVQKLSLEQTKGLLGHEVMHLACGHHLRRNGRNARLWNQACDLAINWLLLDAGLTLPEGFFDDPELRDREVEAIYEVLLERSEKQGESGENGEQGESEVSGGGHGEGGLLETDSSSQASEGKNKENSGKGKKILQLAGAGGEKDEQEAEYGDPGKSGEVRDARGVDGGAPTPAEHEQLAQEAEADFIIAFQQAKSFGSLPQGIARLVRARLFPQLNWAELLRRFIELSASNDYSWSPPNRRYIHAGLYLPSTRAQDLPHTIVAVDTSGSISPAELDQFAAELSSILYDFDTIVSVVYCDSAVSGVQEFARMDLPLKLSPKGGGGTDYCPVFSWVEENGIQPACLVYLTDLECNRYPAEPYYPVLWVTTSPNRLPPFGERIQLAL